MAGPAAQTAEWMAFSAGGAGLAFNAVRAAKPGGLHVVTSLIIVCGTAAPAGPVTVTFNDGTNALVIAEFAARGTQVFDFGAGFPAAGENQQVQLISGVPGGAVLATGIILGFTI